jgi:hypothetical protein
MTIKEKVYEAHQLALEVCGIGDPELADLSALPMDVQDRLWGHADGLFAGYVEKRISGRCSLQATMDFDMTALEKELDDVIAEFTDLAKRARLARKG